MKSWKVEKLKIKGLVETDDVGEIVGDSGAADGAEEIEAEGCADEQPPRTVVQQRLEIGAYADSGYCLYTLSRQGKASEEEDTTDGGNNHHGVLPGRGRRGLRNR